MINTAKNQKDAKTIVIRDCMERTSKRAAIFSRSLRIKTRGSVVVFCFEESRKGCGRTELW